MSQPLDLQDLSIVLAARDHSSTMAHPDFLRGSGIVPSDWELARPPVLAANAAQIIFKNGVRIEAKPGTVSFAESLDQGAETALQIPALAQRYAAALPNLEFRGVGINPRRFVTVGEQENSAHQFITERILAAGASWQQFGTAPMQAVVNLSYQLEHCQLQLSINEARLQISEAESVPAVLFAGNFHYALAEEASAERLQHLNQAIASWQSNLLAYQYLIDQQFLAGVREAAASVLPAMAV